MYDQAMSGIKHKLIYRTKANQMIYTAELSVRRDNTGAQFVPAFPFPFL